MNNCPHCGHALNDPIETEREVFDLAAEWREWIENSGRWVSPDGRVRTGVAAHILNRSEGTLRNWRTHDVGPKYLRGPIVTYALAELARFKLSDPAYWK